MWDHTCAVLLVVEAVLLVPFIIIDYTENSSFDFDFVMSRPPEHFLLPSQSGQQIGLSPKSLRKVSFPLSRRGSDKACFQINLLPSDLPGLFGGRDEKRPSPSYQQCKLFVDPSQGAHGLHIMKCMGLQPDNNAMIPANTDSRSGIQLIFLTNKNKNEVRTLYEQVSELLPRIKDQLMKQQSTATDLSEVLAPKENGDISNLKDKVTVYYIVRSDVATCSPTEQEKLEGLTRPSRFKRAVGTAARLISLCTTPAKEHLKETWRDLRTAVLKDSSQLLDVLLINKVTTVVCIVATLWHWWFTASVRYTLAAVLVVQPVIAARLWSPLQQHLAQQYSPVLSLPVAVASLVQHVIIAKDPYTLAVPGRVALRVLEYPALLLLAGVETLVSLCMLLLITAATALIFDVWYTLEAASLMGKILVSLMSIPVTVAMFTIETSQASAMFCLGPCVWLLERAANRAFRFLCSFFSILDRVLTVCFLPALVIFSSLEIVQATTAMLLGALFYYPAATTYRVFSAVAGVFLIRPCIEELDLLDDCVLHECKCAHVKEEPAPKRRSRRLGSKYALNRHDVTTPGWTPENLDITDMLREDTWRSKPETPKIPETKPETPKTPTTKSETPKTPKIKPETPKSPKTKPETPKTPKTKPETPKTPTTKPETPKTKPETPKTKPQPPKTPKSPFGDVGSGDKTLRVVVTPPWSMSGGARRGRHPDIQSVISPVLRAALAGDSLQAVTKSSCPEGSTGGGRSTGCHQDAQPQM